MSNELWLKARAMSKRQVVVRGGVLVFGLTAGTLWVLQQTYLLHSPRYARLRLGFILLDIFTLSWIVLGGLLVWKLNQREQQAAK